MIANHCEEEWMAVAVVSKEYKKDRIFALKIKRSFLLG